MNQATGSGFAAKLSSLAAITREGGLRGAVRFLSHRLHEEFNERRLRIRTRGYISKDDLGFQGTELNSYLGAPYRALWYSLDQLALHGAQDVFLDIGSGMGRVVIVAATKPFRRVIGVEISPALVEQARRNVERAQARLSCPVTIVAADATTYAVPDDVTVIHLFNPFVGDTLARVVRNIRASQERRPRPLTILYGQPGQFEAMFLAEGWLRKTNSRAFYPAIEYAVYECAVPSH